MRRLWMALVTVVALSVGIAWAQSNGKASEAGMDCSGCCCTAQTCQK